MTYNLEQWETGYMDGIKGKEAALTTLEYKAGFKAGAEQRKKEIKK